ncbi:hypothetical protein SAMN03159489_03353 [Pseudomonas sp. NFPP07]|uniref:DUF5677 domain-containing protein n=1 Tax=Pseudomonas sp. NFPP07 TaxID=1566213 RepID=UPI0008EBEEA2|nr:DUF5677 domain-containing protein [Pseudomonas sp. NFPP07]SFQ38520.1 hypothetical protein SAMN03159489_03353 [Pseudomonas sp. NFPP07]
MIDSLTNERSSEVEREFEVLITLMADMIMGHAEANQHVHPPKWALDLHVLSMKLFKHLCSIRTLLKPCGLETGTLPRFGYIDHSSVSALTRTAVENYLVMYWLYSNGDESLREFRHTVWKYCGWKKRSKLVPTIEEAKISHQEAVDTAAELMARIEASPYFKDYSVADKKSLRKGNWSAGSNWNDLAEKAGLHRIYFTSIYPYLSGYTHSDFISCLQIGQAQTLNVQYSLGVASLQISLLMIGHFSHFYAELFPTAKEILEHSGEAFELATKWHIKTDDMAFLYDRVGVDETSPAQEGHTPGSAPPPPPANR